MSNEWMLASPERVKENLNRLETSRWETEIITSHLLNNAPALVNLANMKRGDDLIVNTSGSTEEMHASIVDESVERFKKSVQWLAK